MTWEGGSRVEDEGVEGRRVEGGRVEGRKREVKYLLYMRLSCGRRCFREII